MKQLIHHCAAGFAFQTAPRVAIERVFADVEIERAQFHIQMEHWAIDAVKAQDLAELCITSDAKLEVGEGPKEAFRLPDLLNIAVVFHKAEGAKCARSWKISKDIGQDKDFPDITPRDAAAVREWMHRFGKTV